MVVRRSYVRGAVLLAVSRLDALAAGLHLFGAVTAATALDQASMEVQASDFAFAAPDTVEAGYVTIDFSNAGAETHHVAIERLPETLSVDDFNAALQGDERAALEWSQFELGGVAAIDPGQTGEAVVNLQAGAYALICVIPSRDGVPHVLKGMIKPLIVTPSSAVGSAPTSSGEITLQRLLRSICPEVVPAARSRTTSRMSAPAIPS